MCGSRFGDDSDPDRLRDDQRTLIRVLWLVKGLGPGGMERLLTLSARRRDRSRFDVRVGYLLPQKTALVPELEAVGVDVECLGHRHVADPRWLRNLRTSLRLHPVEIVHAHSPLMAVAARVIVRTMPRSRRPAMVTTDHSLWTGHPAPMRWANAVTARIDDASVAVSEAIRSSIPASLRRRVEVVIHGVDVQEVLAQGSARDEVRAELGIEDDQVVVGTVANLRPVKAYPDLLRAARRVLDDRGDVRFVTVGQGPQRDQVHALHADLGLGDRVLLLGHRRDAVRVMSACDIFCLPSLHEGLPVAMMEALALGLPVVATSVGGVVELVEDGCQALLVEPGSPEQLADAILQLVRDPARRAAMADRARQTGASLSIDDAVRRTEELYSDLARTETDPGAPASTRSSRSRIMPKRRGVDSRNR